MPISSLWVDRFPSRQNIELHMVLATCTSTSFPALMRSGQGAAFWSAVSARLSDEGLSESHRLLVVPTGSGLWPGEGRRPCARLEALARRCGFFLRVWGADKRVQPWPDAPLIAAGNPSYDLDSPLNYTDRRGRVVQPGLRSASLLLRSTRRMRTFLDAQARPLYVVSPVVLARRPDELDRAAALELWTAALPLLRGHEGSFEAMELNVGAFQNLPHLHLKVWVAPGAHEERWRANATYRRLRRLSAHLPAIAEDGDAGRGRAAGPGDACSRARLWRHSAVGADVDVGQRAGRGHQQERFHQ